MRDILVLMMLPFAQPIVEASETNSPWLGCWQSERQEFENWPGRFATAARSQTSMRLLSAGVEGKRSQYANTKPCNFSPLHNESIILLNWRTNISGLQRQADNVLSRGRAVPSHRVTFCPSRGVPRALGHKPKQIRRTERSAIVIVVCPR